MHRTGPECLSHVAPPEYEHLDQGKGLKFGSVVHHEGAYNALQVNVATEDLIEDWWRLAQPYGKFPNDPLVYVSGPHYLDAGPGLGV